MILQKSSKKSVCDSVFTEKKSSKKLRARCDLKLNDEAVAFPRLILGWNPWNWNRSYLKRLFPMEKGNLKPAQRQCIISRFLSIPDWSPRKKHQPSEITQYVSFNSVLPEKRQARSCLEPAESRQKPFKGWHRAHLRRKQFNRPNLLQIHVVQKDPV